MYKIRIQNEKTGEVTKGISDCLPAVGVNLRLKVIDPSRDGTLVTPIITHVEANYFLTHNNKYTYGVQTI